MAWLVVSGIVAVYVFVALVANGILNYVSKATNEKDGMFITRQEWAIIRSIFWPITLVYYSYLLFGTVILFSIIYPIVCVVDWFKNHNLNVSRIGFKLAEAIHNLSKKLIKE